MVEMARYDSVGHPHGSAARALGRAVNRCSRKARAQLSFEPVTLSSGERAIGLFIVPGQTARAGRRADGILPETQGVLARVARASGYNRRVVVVAPETKSGPWMWWAREVRS